MCVRVCVCERERERKIKKIIKREWERVDLKGSGPVSVHAKPLGVCIHAGLYCVALRTPDQLRRKSEKVEVP